MHQEKNSSGRRERKSKREKTRAFPLQRTRLFLSAQRTAQKLLKSEDVLLAAGVGWWLIVQTKGGIEQASAKISLEERQAGQKF